jgi:flagellar biosynthesis protein FlhG
MVDDQVDRLRQQREAEKRAGFLRPIEESRGGLRITITSGKGGVGKSNFALNTAIAMAGLGKRVLLVDADTNLANLDLLLGITPKFNLADVVTGSKSMKDIDIAGPGGIDILPGASGDIFMLGLDEQVEYRLLDSFTELEESHDVIIIDTGAGLSRQIVSYAASADDVVVVTSPEPTSRADAYAMIKVISQSRPTLPLHLLVNMVRSAEEAMDVFDGLNLVVQTFLKFPIRYLGHVPFDPNVMNSVATQHALMLEYPRSAASVAIRMTAHKLLRGVNIPSPEEKESLLSRMFQSRRHGSD